MKIEDLLILRYENSVVDAKALIEDCVVQEFAEIDDVEFFEAIKTTLKKHLDYNGYGPASLSYVNSVVGVMVLKDEKRYIYLKMRIKNFQDGNESLINLTIHPFGCFRAYGKNVCEEIAEKEISKAVRNFLARELGTVYVDKNNEYFTKIKNENEAEIEADAESKINAVRDEYIENIIM